jgi:hypothetical protein
MDKPFNVSALGLARKPFGRFHMHGTKCLRSTF